MTLFYGKGYRSISRFASRAPAVERSATIERLSDDVVAVHHAAEIFRVRARYEVDGADGLQRSTQLNSDYAFQEYAPNTDLHNAVYDPRGQQRRCQLSTKHLAGHSSRVRHANLQFVPVAQNSDLAGAAKTSP